MMQGHGGGVRCRGMEEGYDAGAWRRGTRQGNVSLIPLCWALVAERDGGWQEW